MDRVLYLTRDFPFPATNGGKIRDLQILRALSEKREIELLCWRSTSDEHREPTLPDWLPISKLTLIRQSPKSPESNEAWSQAIKEARSRCSLLWVSQNIMGPHLRQAKDLKYSIVWDTVAIQSKIIFENAFRSFRTLPNVVQAIRQLFAEKRLARAARIVVVSSEIEAFRMRRLAPAAKIKVVPHCIDLENYADARKHEGTTLFFSGGLDKSANIEALDWFVDEIWPRLRGALSDQLPRIVVAGSNPSSEMIVKLRNAGIELHANPHSILPYLKEAAVVFVPIRSGGGTRHKILEAMAAGKAVVSTGKGAEGLALAPCFDLWIADSPDPFAKHIVKLLRDPKLRAETGANGLKNIENRYDWTYIHTKIAEISDTFE